MIRRLAYILLVAVILATGCTSTMTWTVTLDPVHLGAS